jgi:hypothetical protein
MAAITRRVPPRSTANEPRRGVMAVATGGGPPLIVAVAAPADALEDYWPPLATVLASLAFAS